MADSFDDMLKRVQGDQQGDAFNKFMQERGIQAGGSEAPAEGQSPGFLESAGGALKREAYAAGQGLLKGAAGVAGFPGLAERGIDWVGRKLPPYSERDLAPVLPTPEDYVNKLQGMGLLDKEWKPGTVPEAVAEGLGTATPGLAFGAGMSLPQNLAYTYGPAIAAKIGALGGVPESWTAPATALGMSGLERVGTNLLEKRAAASGLANADRALQEYQLGGPDFKQQQQDLMTGAKGQGALDRKQMQDAAQETLANKQALADSAIEQTASGFGKSRTLQEGAEAMQGAAREWDKNVFGTGGRIKDLENEMGKVVPEDAAGNLSHFQDVLNNSYTKAGGLDKLAAAFRSRLPDSEANLLDSMIKQQQGEEATGPLMTVFRDIKGLRSHVGDFMRSPELSKGIDQSKLAEMYRALTDDMRSAASSVPGGAAAFDKFNSEAKPLYDLRDGPVSDLITTMNAKGEKIRPEEALSALMSQSGKGGSQLQRMRQEPELAKGLDEVMAAQLRANPKGWSGFSPEAKVAFAKDQGTADSVDAALASKQQAVEEAKQAGVNAKAVEASRKSVAEVQKAAAGTARENQGNALQVARDKAQERVAVASPQWSMRDLAHHLGEWGTEAAVGLHSITPQIEAFSQNALNGQLGEVAGYLGPMAAWGIGQGVKGVIKNPASMRNALQGYVGTAPWGGN